MKEQQIVSDEDLQAIFGNVEDILKLAQTFRQKLNERAPEWPKLNQRDHFVGDILLSVVWVWIIFLPLYR